MSSNSSSVTFKDLAKFYDEHRDNFSKFITKDIHNDLIMNSDLTPAEMLNRWNKRIAKNQTIAMSEVQFKKYYPNEVFVTEYTVVTRNITQAQERVIQEKPINSIHLKN